MWRKATHTHTRSQQTQQQQQQLQCISKATATATHNNPFTFRELRMFTPLCLPSCLKWWLCECLQVKGSECFTKHLRIYHLYICIRDRECECAVECVCVNVCACFHIDIRLLFCLRIYVSLCIPFHFSAEFPIRFPHFPMHYLQIVLHEYIPLAVAFCVYVCKCV